MKNALKTVTGAAAIGLTLAVNAAAQDADYPPMEEEVFNVCAVDSLTRVSEELWKAPTSSMVEAPDYVDVNGTRLTLNADSSVSASGPQADKALKYFIACYSDPNLTF